MNRYASLLSKYADLASVLQKQYNAYLVDDDLPNNLDSAATFVGTLETELTLYAWEWEIVAEYLVKASIS